MNYTFRPINWTGPRTPADSRRSRHAFTASWTSTLTLLSDELHHLGAQHVVIEADFRERDIRLDGMIRADAPTPTFPGVRIAFDSRYGPLVYQADAHAWWRHNVRAIALSLEALRAVDRYGVTHHAEQYTGWRQLGTGPATPMPGRTPMSPAAAEEFLYQHSGLTRTGVSTLRDHYRAAARRLHPDNGGDTGDFQRLQEARRVLGEALH